MKFQNTVVVAVALLVALPSQAAVANQMHATVGPSIALTRDGDRVTITFSGTLQMAEMANGPWIDVLNASSPVMEDAAKTQRFYRARQPAPESIFATTSVVLFSLTGPFQTNFDLAFAGTPDGIVPPVRVKNYFDAILDMATLTLPVTVRVRGNSSLQECPFPKLKMKVSKENRAGTPFFDAREIKIGTHCAEGGQGNIGRLRDERAAWREALAYETMNLLGFVGRRVRRARIDYHDTGATNELGTSGWTVTRNAFIADDIEVVAQRLGGRALTAEEIAVLRDAHFDTQLITNLLLLHTLLGNWDYVLSPDGQGLWNTDVIELVDKSRVPVAGDFDLASFVTGIVRLSVPREYHPELGDVERQMLYNVEAVQVRVSRETFAAGSELFLQRRQSIESHISTAEIDDAGRANSLRHLAAFYDALAAVIRVRG